MIKLFPENSIFSYLQWRGDIDLKKAPFNEVDALVLAIFSYLNLDGIVPTDFHSISLQETAKKYFSAKETHDDYIYYQHLLKLMAEADRFKKAKLSYYVNHLDKETQFSAIRIELENGLNFIAFRGTDDSLVGWKEDFEISFKTTSAQAQARRYLEKIVEEQSHSFILGGHSKGGNLAEYAALHINAQYQSQIDKIYTFDSPGIAQEVENKLPNTSFLQKKLKRYVPEYSIIGRLFEPKEIAPVIVASSRKSLSQHDAFSWQISGSHFITRRRRNAQSRIYNQLINDWIDDATLSERESLTNDLFNSLAASGATKINELNKNGFGGFGAILLSLTNSSRRTRFVFGSLFSAIWHSLKSRGIPQMFFTTDSIVGWIMVILGIITITTPQYSLRAFGALVALAGIGFSATQIINTANSKLKNGQKRFFIISWLIVFALSIALISNNRLLIFLAHYFLGMFLVIYAYVRMRQIILNKFNGIFRKIIIAIEALLSFALGIIITVNPNYFTRSSLIFGGIILIIYGFFKLIAELFAQRKRMPPGHRK